MTTEQKTCGDRRLGTSTSLPCAYMSETRQSIQRCTLACPRNITGGAGKRATVRVDSARLAIRQINEKERKQNMKMQIETVEELIKRHPSIKTVVEEMKCLNENTTHYISTLYWKDTKEKPVTLVLTYGDVVEYAKRGSTDWDEKSGCFTGLWKDNFDLFATKYVTRKLVLLYMPKILEQDVPQYLLVKFLNELKQLFLFSYLLPLHLLL